MADDLRFGPYTDSVLEVVRLAEGRRILRNGQKPTGVRVLLIDNLERIDDFAPCQEGELSWDDIRSRASEEYSGACGLHQAAYQGRAT